MKNKLTDRAPRKKATYNSNSQDNGTEDKIIGLVDLVEEDNPAPTEAVRTEELIANYHGAQSLKVGKEVEVTRNAGAKDGVLNRAAGSDAGRVTEDANSTLVREQTAEWDVYTTLYNFFDSCDLEASKLVGEAEESGKERQVRSDNDNVLREKSSGDLNAKPEVDSENSIFEEKVQAEDELLEDLFDDLEVKFESSTEDDTQEEMSAAEDDLPLDLFDDVEVETMAVSVNGAVEGKVNLDDGLSKDLFVNLKHEGKATATEPGDMEVLQPRVGSTSRFYKEDWVDSNQYFLKLRAIDKKVVEYQRKIEKLMAKKEKMKKGYEHLNDILYKKGDELKKAVSMVLKEYWSLKITYMNKEKRASFDENIIIQFDGRNILAKIKSTDKRKLPNKFITQVWQDLHFSKLGTSAEGALIVNHDMKSNEKDKVPEYVEIDKELLEDIIFIDTRVLHKLTAAILHTDLSVDEAKRILFKKGRVEFSAVD